MLFYRIRAAALARDTIYGYKARPFGMKIRDEWASIIGGFTRRRRLRYREVMDVARELAITLREEGMIFPPAPTHRGRCGRPEDFHPEFDRVLRRRFLDALVAKSKYLGKTRRRRSPDLEGCATYGESGEKGKRLGIALEALRERFCPVCARDFPPPEAQDCHGYRAFRIDDRGRLSVSNP